MRLPSCRNFTVGTSLGWCSIWAFLNVAGNSERFGLRECFDRERLTKADVGIKPDSIIKSLAELLGLLEV